MKDLELSVQDIKELMSAMNKNNIADLKLEQGGFKLELEGCKTVQQIAAPVFEPPAQPLSDDGYWDEILDGYVVRSPIVGTFYAAPAPDREPFVKVGSRVKKGDVLFIIESMKLMNEVDADRAGTVAEIMVENGQPVEYGQPILRLE